MTAVMSLLGSKMVVGTRRQALRQSADMSALKMSLMLNQISLSYYVVSDHNLDLLLLLTVNLCDLLFISDRLVCFRREFQRLSRGQIVYHQQVKNHRACKY